MNELSDMETELREQGADEWEEFCAAELPVELQTPCPGFAMAEPGVTAERLAELMQDSAILELEERYTDLDQVVAIAEQFQEWCAERPDGESVLLQAEEGVDYWFAGDLHAAFDVLLAAWALVRDRAQKSGRRGCLVLLGDVMDRGMDDIPCLAMIEDMLMRGGVDGVSVLYLRGNHDEALRQSPRGVFYSQVVPAETADTLNELRAEGPHGAAEAVGRAAMELSRVAPVVAELTGLGLPQNSATIMLAHGGLPHLDLQEYALTHADEFPVKEGAPLYESVPEEERPKWSDDFLWNRLKPRVASCPPLRGMAGNYMGTHDVNTYRAIHYRLTGRAVTCLVRGHDHEPEGWRLYSYDPVYNEAESRDMQRNCTVLGINTMGHAADNPYFSRALPSLVHWCYGAPVITLYRLPVGR